MKQLTCEMCGSNDVIKRGELFVCQCCNTKYSVETAKKLMFEGIVRIDNSKKLSKLYQAARTAWDDEDYRRAKKYYKEILRENPVCWESTFFAKYADVQETMTPDIYTLEELVSVCLAAMRLIQGNTNDIATKREAVDTVVEITISFISKYIGRLRNTYDCRKENDSEIVSWRHEIFETNYHGIKRLLNKIIESITQIFKQGNSNRDEIIEKINEVQSELEICYSEYHKHEYYTGGCYIATCIYGSYNCPQVWTLRRYRDNALASTWYGRVFIRTYYAISPTLVKCCGHTRWFKKLWKGKLDKMVSKLQKKGFESTSYEDKSW